jgi:hypothetical protein
MYKMFISKSFHHVGDRRGSSMHFSSDGIRARVAIFAFRDFVNRF